MPIQSLASTARERADLGNEDEKTIGSSLLEVNRLLGALWKLGEIVR